MIVLTVLSYNGSPSDGPSAAFDELGRAPVAALEPGIIGPPLKETLALLAGTEDPEVIESLAAGFKRHYDTEGYKATEVFPGVPQMLSALAALFPLYIATNKRIGPTRSILGHLGWTGHFREVHALDSFSPPAKNKREMIARVLSAHGLDPTRTLYVGDRDEDEHAATGNGLPFALACWGYGVPAGRSSGRCSSQRRHPTAPLPTGKSRLAHRLLTPLQPRSGHRAPGKFFRGPPDATELADKGESPCRKSSTATFRRSTPSAT